MKVRIYEGGRESGKLYSELEVNSSREAMLVGVTLHGVEGKTWDAWDENGVCVARSAVAPRQSPTSEGSPQETGTSYTFSYGQIFLSGGLDVSVVAATQAEAQERVERALRRLCVDLSESQTIDGVRVAYTFSVQETILGEVTEDE